MKNPSRFMHVSLAFLFSVSMASATLLYYDGIPVSGTGAYVSEANLGANNVNHASIVGFTVPGKWSNDTTGLKVNATGLIYPSGISLTPIEGAIRYNRDIATNTYRTAFRTIPAGNLAGDFYFSALMRYQDLAPWKVDGLWLGIGLSATSPGGNTSLPRVDNGFVLAYKRVIDESGSRICLVLMAGGQTQVLLATATPNDTHFVTLKFTRNVQGTDDLIQASVVTTPEEPTSWMATIQTTLLTGTQTFGYLSAGGYGNTAPAPSVNLVDEIRIGTTYADVAGVFGQPPVFELVGTTVDQITSTSADFHTRLANPGAPAGELFALWGESAGGQTFANWAHSALVANAVATATPYHHTPALAPDKTYFYTFAAINDAATAWAYPSPASFITAPVTVSAPAAMAENSLTPAIITLARSDIAAVKTEPLTVHFTLSGTAVRGTHYHASAINSVLIPAGAASATLTITPLPDWDSEDDHTLVITLQPGAYILPDQHDASITFINAVLPEAPVNAFLGTVSELASNPANWSLGVVPHAGHEVMITQSYAARNPIWDVAAPVVVGSWTQPVGSTNTVFFDISPAQPLTILHDCNLLGGVWTHTGPSATPTTAVAVNIQGNLNLGPGGTINVGRDITTYDPGGNSRGHRYQSGPGYVAHYGAAYAGEGFYRASTAPYALDLNQNTYGSILNPVAYGASSHGGGGAGALLKYSGPGLVMLNVAQTATLNGRIAADGYAYSNNSGGASGGTLNLTFGSIEGTGSITANGGTDTYYGSGSGGRIRIKLTHANASLTPFKGVLSAYGGDGVPARANAPSAAGTIVLITQSNESEPTLRVANNITFITSTNAPTLLPATHLPSMGNPGEDLSKTSWEVYDNAKLRITKSTRIKSLSLISTASPVTDARTPCIFADDVILSTSELKILNDLRYAPGIYRAADLQPGVLIGTGAIQVISPGSLLLLR